MKEKLTCTGESSICMRTGEAFCTSIVPDWNDDRYECVHATRAKIIEAGTGSSTKLKKVYLCNLRNND